MKCLCMNPVSTTLLRHMKISKIITSIKNHSKYVNVFFATASSLIQQFLTNFNVDDIQYEYETTECLKQVEVFDENFGDEYSCTNLDILDISSLSFVIAESSGYKEMTPPSDHDYAINVFSALDCEQPVITLPNRADSEQDFYLAMQNAEQSSCFLSPPSSTRSSSPMETYCEDIVVDDCYINQTAKSNSSCETLNCSIETCQDNEKVNSEKFFCQNHEIIVQFKQSFNSSFNPEVLTVKSKRGRPRKSIDVHLKKVKSKKVSAQEKKIASNNAASILYRRKRALQTEHLQKNFIREFKRNKQLKDRSESLQTCINRMKLLMETNSY